MSITAMAQTAERDIAGIAEHFFREGCTLIPGVLRAEETSALRERTDYYVANPTTPKKHLSYVGDTFVLRRCEELGPPFAEMATHSEIVRLLEAVLGSDVRFNAMNVIRNRPGSAISMWHVDDVVEFPLPPEIPRFDARIRMPVFWLTVQIALSDIDAIEHGPTQFVPGSHYSGRRPEGDEPRFEGRGAEPMLCKAGDIYLFNHQCWHRGAPNLSDRTRYLMQVQFAQRWADARFKGMA